MIEAIALLIGVAVVLAISVWYTSRILEALRTVTRALVTVHEREADRQKDLLNRFMARDFDHYQLYAQIPTPTDLPISDDEVSDEELRRERPWITGPAEPEDTPADILEELEEVNA